MIKQIIKTTILIVMICGNLHAYITSFDTTLQRVVDGDTIVINGDIKVRLACVDAYETSKTQRLKAQAIIVGKAQDEVLNLGIKQKQRLEAYVGKKITIFYDDKNKFDKYGRMLAVARYSNWYGNTILNTGLEYYNQSYLCKYFNLD